MDKLKDIPQHVAVIMDGNGRWAAQRGLPRIAGHRAGVKAAEETMKAAGDMGVKVLTLYTFSTENWKRPRSEVAGLFRLLEGYLGREGGRLKKNNIRFRVIGRWQELPEPLRGKLASEMENTRDNTGLIVNLALNYGGRPEIVDAARAIARAAAGGKIDPDDIDEAMVADHLYTRGLPDPDLLIRTSGESRISNFLLWQVAYSEICILKKLWPDFGGDDFRRCIIEYRKRDRRFGG